MPQVFGWEHITYTAIAVLLAVAGILFTRKYAVTEKKLELCVKLTALCLLGAIIFNRVSIAVYGENRLLLIPDSFCGFSSLLLAVVTLLTKRDSIFLHGVCYIGFIGGLITTVYPDFIGQASSIFFSKTISGLLHHTIMLYLIVLMVATKYFVPIVKKWYAAVITGMFYMTVGLFLVTALKRPDAMHINTPLLEGTCLYWYVVSAIFLAVYFASMTVYELIKKRVKAVKAPCPKE